MTDPRNIAHHKKVWQEKKHQGEAIASGAEKTPHPERRRSLEHPTSDDPELADEAASISTEEKPLKGSSSADEADAVGRRWR